VAEQFRVLDALAPGRIDLGLGRAPGSDGLTAYALHPMADERPNHFPADVRDLLAWVSGQPLMDKHPFAEVQALPKGETVPEAWILGSSNYGAQVAAHFGLPYCFAWFFSDGRGGPEALAAYRQNYRPSALWPKPHAALCVFALTAPTRDEAEFHYMSRAKWQIYRDRGTFLAFEPPEVAAAHPFTEAERARITRLRSRAFVGAPAEVAAMIRAMAQEFDLAEMALVTWTHDETVRRRSFTLLAQEFGLGAASVG
ncbi:MAG: MsnO8 family LLM class oxidoreductase, partial [Alphaproteobacteria bacterium]|nr:MsnO8 family LLM class oxidoreductase [Alphaproteobacteria bacterium]